MKHINYSHILLNYNKLFPLIQLKDLRREKKCSLFSTFCSLSNEWAKNQFETIISSYDNANKQEILFLFLWDHSFPINDSENLQRQQWRVFVENRNRSSCSLLQQRQIDATIVMKTFRSSRIWFKHKKEFQWRRKKKNVRMNKV